MIDTFLFDLDGTLLPLNADKFMQVYFGEMANAFKDIIDPEVLIKNIWKATEAMVSNLEHRTNEEIFMETFFKLMDVDKDLYMMRFDKFYDEGFLNVQTAVSEHELIKESIEILKQKNYDLIIATNPLFPEKAIRRRVTWAGLNPDDFSYISFYEKSHYCKPQVQYYEEILKKQNKRPEQCIMVGNDVQEDLVAAKLGITTFLITDNVINRTEAEPVCDYIGKYEDFYEFVKNLQKA